MRSEAEKALRAFIAALLCVGAGVGLLIVLCRAMYRVDVTRGRNSEALHNAGELVTAHLSLNDDRWPTNWNDLEQTFRQLLSTNQIARTNHGRVWSSGDLRISSAWVERVHSWGSKELRITSTMAELKERIEIDWTVGPAELAKLKTTNDLPSIRLIWVKNGNGGSWDSANPNVMVYDYLHPKEQEAGRKR